MFINLNIRLCNPVEMVYIRYYNLLITIIERRWSDKSFLKGGIGFYDESR